MFTDSFKERQMAEQHRYWFYAACAVVILALIVVDVARGADATDWIEWLARLLGLGAASLAIGNTSRKKTDA